MGLDAEHVDGTSTDRKEILKRFAQKQRGVLCNAMLLTEGYDEPKVEGIILARPTRSTLLYTQMIGRGTRLSPGKENVTIIDIVDVTREHSLTTLPGLFNLSPHFDLEGHTTDEVQKAIQWVELNRPWISVDQAESLSDLRYRCTKINLFDLELPYEISAYSNFAWVGFGKGGYRLGLTHGKAMVVLPTILGRFEIQYRQNHVEKVLTDKSDLDSAIKAAERFVRKNFRDLLVLVKLDTPWRRQPATEKQLKILKSKKIDVPKGLTRGQASHLIGMLS